MAQVVNHNWRCLPAGSPAAERRWGGGGGGGGGRLGTSRPRHRPFIVCSLVPSVATVVRSCWCSKHQRDKRTASKLV